MPTLNRREFFHRNAIALAAAVLTPRVLQSDESVTSESLSFYRFSLGELQITAFSDGSFPLPAEFFGFNLEPAKREHYLRSRFVPVTQIPMQVSPMLIDFGNRRVLVDAGAIPGGARSGRLTAALAAAGVPRDSINMVVLTHAHTDHLGSVVDAQSLTLNYPNAEIILSDVEHNLWIRDDAATRLPEWSRPLVAQIQPRLRAVNDRIRIIKSGEDVVSGMRSIASPGHTPGHLAFAVESAGQKLLLVGDSITNVHMAFEEPAWHLMVDLDRDQAGETRKRLLDQAATEEILIMGYHFPFPGLGYVLRAGNGFRFHTVVAPGN